MGLCPKKMMDILPGKAEKVMGMLDLNNAFSPTSWEQCFLPNQEPVGRGAASD